MEGHDMLVPGETVSPLYLEGLKMIQIIRYANACHKEAESSRKEAIEAKEVLSQTPGMRNALMGMAVDEGNEGVQLDTVLAFHLEVLGAGNDPHSNKRKKAGGDLKRQKASNIRRREMYRKMGSVCERIFQDPTVGSWCTANFPLLNERRLLHDHVFLCRILGEENVLHGTSLRHLTMGTIFSRLEKAENKLGTCTMDLRGRRALGNAWLPTLLQRDEILQDLEFRWHQYLSNEITRKGYLDVMAGVQIPGCQSHRSGVGRAATPKGGEDDNGHDVDTEGPVPDEISSHVALPDGGGVFQWSRGCFSQSFLDYFQKDALPTIGFMKDPLVASRYVRCESPLASSTNPIFFQVGLPPKAVLFQAVESSKFGDALLLISNFLERERYKFFFAALCHKYDSRVATSFTPKMKEYDLLLGVISHKAFSFHSDSNECLYNEEVAGYEEKYLRVITMFFQNQPDGGISQLQYRRKKNAIDPGTDVISHLAVGANGIHEQGNFVQDRYMHQCSYSGRSRNFQRCFWTARATGECHLLGLQKLRERQSAGIQVYGRPGSTPYYDVFGSKLFSPRTTLASPTARDPVHNRALSFDEQDTENENEDGDMEGVESEDESHGVSGQRGNKDGEYLEDIYMETEGGSESEEGCDQFDMDLSGLCNTTFPPSRHSPHYPDKIGTTPSKQIDHPKNLCHMFASKEGFQLLMSQGYHLERQDARGDPVRFGAYPSLGGDPEKPFASVGDVLSTEDVCRYYGMAQWSAQWKPPFNGTIEVLNAIILSKMYKASVEMPPSDTYPSGLGGPSQEARMKDSRKRRGFFMYLAGGNARQNNNRDHGARFMAPRDQTLADYRNRLFGEAALRGRVVSAFFADQNLPRGDRVSPEGHFLCVYGGMYEVQKFEVCAAWDARDIVDAVERTEVLAATHHLDAVPEANFSFLLCRHIRCWMHPVEAGVVSKKPIHDWQTISLPYKDDLVMTSTVAPNFALRDFVLNPSLVSEPKELMQAYLAKAIAGSDPDDRNIPLDASLGTAPTRRVSLDKLVGILKRILAAYAFRQLEVNVRDDGTVGCLWDLPQTLKGKNGTRTLGSKQYRDILGDGEVQYCASLGSNIQFNCYPCPFPAGEENILYLHECNIGGHPSYRSARVARNGKSYLERKEAAGLLLQCFITETTGYPPLNWHWWCLYDKGESDASGPRLPSNETELRHYLQFIKKAISDTGLELSGFFHGHYVMNSKFSSYGTLSLTLLSICRNVDQFLQQMVEEPLPTRQDEVRRLQSMSSAVTPIAWDSYHAGKVISAMEELISGKPFGNYEQEEGMKGGATRASDGVSLVDWPLPLDGDLEDQYHACQSLLLCQMKGELQKDAESWFGYLTLSKDTRVCQAFTGEELDHKDFLHIMEIVARFMELEHSCKVVSSVQNSRYFPFRGIAFPKTEELATRAVEIFKSCIQQEGINYFANYSRPPSRSHGMEDALFPKRKRRRGKTVYTNLQDPAKKPLLPRHEYYSHTWACGEAWELEAAAKRGSNRNGRGSLGWQMRVLENGESLPLQDISLYEGLPDTIQPLLRAVRETEAFLTLSARAPVGRFSNTFTVHRQTEENSRVVSAYYYHRDKGFACGGRVFIVPTQGESYFVVGRRRTSLKQPDSMEEFKCWLRTLGKVEQDNVTTFLHGFQNYASQFGQDDYYVYKLCPGRAIVFDSVDLVHGTIVPIQEDGEPREILLFHPLELR